MEDRPVYGIREFRGRSLHEHIKDRVHAALAGRPVTWLAEESGVPQSTLSGQMARPKFSLDVLLRVAEALKRDVTFFIPASSPPEASVTELLNDLDALIRAARARYPVRASDRPEPFNANPVRKSDVG